MTVDWKTVDDARRLQELVAAASNAKQRDRYRVALIAGQGLGDRPELEREQIAVTVGRSRQFVDQWVGRYRTGGIDALVPRRQPGAARRLSAEQEAQLSAMLERARCPRSRSRRTTARSCAKGSSSFSARSTRWPACTSCCTAWGTTT